MATENLQIKVSVDTTQAEQGVKRLKNQFAGVGESSGEAAQSASELASQIEQIRNISALELLGKSLDGVKGKMGSLKQSVQAMKNQFQAAGGWLKQAGDEFKGAFDLDTLRYGLDNSSDRISYIGIMLKESFVSARLAAGSLGKAITALGAAIGVVVGIAAAAVATLGLLAAAWSALALSVSKTTKEISMNAAKIGMSTQAYQEWGYVLETVGVEADELAAFVKTLSDEQAQIKSGAEGASQSFEALGLSVEEVTKMGQQELFTEVVDRLQQVENVVERTALAYQIFGEDAAHLANVMNMSSAQTQQLIQNYRELGGGTSQNLINKSNQLQMAVGNLGTAWTSMVNNLAEAIMPTLTVVINWLAKAIAVVSLFFKTIFNLDSSPAASTGSNMASGMQDYTDATQSATKAVEKLKRTQMGFDELNVVNDPNSSSSGSGGLGGALGGGSMLGAGGMGMDFEIPKFDLSGIRAKFEEYKTLIEDITTFGLIGIGVLMAIAGFMSGNIIMAIAGIAIAGLGIAVGMGDGGTWDRLGQGIMKVIDKIKEYFSKFLDFLAPVWDEIVEMAQAAWGAIKAIWDYFLPYLKPIFEAFKGIWNGLMIYFQHVWEQIKIYAIFVWEVIKAYVQMTWENIKVIWSVAVSFFKTIWDSIKLIFSVVESVFRGDFQGAWNAVKKIFSTWGDFFKGLWNSVTKIFDNWKTYFSKIGTAAWNGIKSAFSNFTSFFSNLWTSLQKTWKNVGTAMGDAIGGAVKGVVNSIFKTIEDRVNGFIKMINNAISAINKIPGVNIGKVKEVKLPRLATGGIVTKSTVANIGENGAEAVLPLENNTEWMDKLADKIAMRNAAPSKIVLQVDGKELGWASINGINGITKQTGNLQLQLL